jgi:hypothetical protein
LVEPELYHYTSPAPAPTVPDPNLIFSIDRFLKNISSFLHLL